MKCPHCSINFHEHWEQGYFEDSNQNNIGGWTYRTSLCPSCKQEIIQVADDYGKPRWRYMHPRSVSRGPVPAVIPQSIAQDYREACDVLSISAKASAALSRRCLQNILRSNGYVAKDLSKEIDLLLNEADTSKSIPTTLRMSIDAVRNFGNFSAHPIDDKTTLQIIDVEPEEAEWCLGIIEDMFDHFYVRPAEAAARKGALDAKLAQAGKPASK